MDGFDDLLVPSRHALEQNPFQDQRSGSPDPWASPFATHDDHSEHSGFGGFGDSTASAFGDNAHHTEPSFGGPTSPGFHAWDTHDTAPVISPISDKHEEEPKTPSISSPPESIIQSPGFRESIPTSIDEVVTPTKTTHDEPPLVLGEGSPTPAPKHVPPPLEAPSSPTSAESPTSPIPATAPASVSHSHTSSLSRSIAPSTTSSTHPAFSSPLQDPYTAAIDHSFSGLSLGGETFGGWQGSQSAFVGTTTFREKSSPVEEEEDDDDDDKPILQSANIDERTKAALSPVSARCV